MGYKYLNQCFETKQEFLDYLAQGCFIHSGGTGGLSSYFVFCTSGADSLTIQPVQISNGSLLTPYTYTPQLITCEPNNLTNSDIYSLAWLVVGVWVVAFGIKKITEVLSKND